MSCGVVLAGGRSTRMGIAKAEIAWTGSTLLRRTVDVLAAACDDVVVVAGPAQVVDVPGAVIVRDRVAGQGPLPALAQGLHTARQRGAAVAFVCATDMPLLQPPLVTAVLAALTPDTDIAVPVTDDHEHPLAAAYATALAGSVDDLVATGERRLRAVFEMCRVRRLSRADLLADPALAAADPHMRGLLNVNTPADLAAARAYAPPQCR